VRHSSRPLGRLGADRRLFEMKLKQSERHIQELFRTRYGVTLEKIDEGGGSDGQTADFELIKSNKRVFVCELKEFERVEPSKKHNWTIIQHPDGSEETYGASNAPNRISRCIYEAYKQLGRYREPKVLIFLNHDAMDYRDLEETYRGYLIFEVGETRIKNTYAKRASEGIIKDVKTMIDLYIWVDSSNTRVGLQDDMVTFLFVSKIGRKIATDNFGIISETA